MSSLLCSTIAANKELHTRLGETVHDVWFTGLRKAAIKTSNDGILATGSIVFKHMFTAGKGAHQTLSRVTILDQSERIAFDPFIISFAYKS